MSRIIPGILFLTLTIAIPAAADFLADWGASYGDEGTGTRRRQEIIAVDTDAAGNRYVAGEFGGQVNLGGATFVKTPGPGTDIFIAKFSPSGAHLWSLPAGGNSYDEVNDIDVTPSGNVALVGKTSSTVFTVAGVSDSAGSSTGAFVVVLDSAGGHGFTRVWDGPFLDEAKSVAWRAGGNSLVVAGTFLDSIDFGGGLSLPSNGSFDYFLAEVGAGGSLIAAEALGGPDVEIGITICLDDSGYILLAGNFSGTVDFGNGPLTSQGDYDACFAKFPAVGSPAIWSQRYGGSTAGDICLPTGATTDGDNFFIAGRFDGTADFGTGALTSAGSGDMFLAAYKSGGTPVWAVRGGSAATDICRGVDYHEERLAVVGILGGPGDFGGLPVSHAGGFDAFLAVYSKWGAAEQAASGGGPNDDAALQVAFDGEGIFLAGYHSGPADFGNAVQIGAANNNSVNALIVQYMEPDPTGVEGTIVPVSTGLDLGLPQPNPFRDAVILEYSSKSDDGIRSAEVYSVSGRLVRSLSRNGTAHSGLLRWDGRNDQGTQVSPGVYFVRATDGVSTTNRRITVLR